MLTTCRTVSVMLCLAFPCVAQARVLELEVTKRVIVELPDVGQVERITGRVELGLNPKDPADARIVDLALAHADAAGLVHAGADIEIDQVADPTRRSGIAVLDMVNRGRKIVDSIFELPANAPLSADARGTFLLAQGHALLTVGWQHDIPREAGTFAVTAPIATNGRKPITGLVRADWTVDAPATGLELGHRGHTPYAIEDENDPSNALTERSGRDTERQVVPRAAWKFDIGGDHPPRISKQGGFQAGKIYELVYRAKDPAVVGVGLAALRDVVAFVKHDERSPLRARYAIAVGFSQSTRLLRHFIYEGFNEQASGAPLIDGVFLHAGAGGRGSFNHRFAQPSRDGHRYSSFFFPTDLFPFASRVTLDPSTGKSAGLLRGRSDPKMILTHPGYDYWGRAASLTHTTPDGMLDLAPMPNERIYHLAGSAHRRGTWSSEAETPLPGSDGFRGDPVDAVFTLRALFVRLVDWVVAGREPPPSRIPRLEDGTLTAVDEVRFPSIPGVQAPHVAHVPYHLDFGPRWSRGIVDREPPGVGPAYPVLVPDVDRLGNELGGVRGWELRAPLGTFAPWQLRSDRPAARTELVDLAGTFVPFATARTSGDDRPAMSELYRDREAFLSRLRAVSDDLIAEGFLLPGDRPLVLRNGAAAWDWLAAEKTRSAKAK